MAYERHQGVRGIMAVLLNGSILERDRAFLSTFERAMLKLEQARLSTGRAPKSSRRGTSRLVAHRLVQPLKSRDRVRPGGQVEIKSVDPRLLA